MIPPPQKPETNNPWFKPAMVFLVKVSGSIVFSSLFGFFIGKKLDIYFNTLPLFISLGLVLGFSFSIFIIFREIKQYKKSIE